MTLNKKQINPRIARWALELQNYSYKIVHRGNDRMRHVDALSRNVDEVLVIEENTLEQTLAIEQGRDTTLASIRTKLETMPSNKYDLQDGLVYKKASDGRLLFYVPQSMETNVIRTCHDDMGHFGKEKVIEKLGKVYWFPKMIEKVQGHIRTCLKCIQFSPNSGRVEGELHSIPKGKVPFDTLHIDHLGPLNSYRNKFRHILVVTDGFTKFVKMYPVKSTSSKETISCLLSYFNAFSRPARLVSDRKLISRRANFPNLLTTKI